MGGPVIYHGGGGCCPGWGGGGGVPAGVVWRERYIPASEFLPSTGITGALPPVPVGLEMTMTPGTTQGGSALRFAPPGVFNERALCTWMAPDNFDNHDLPWFQLYFTVDQDGAIGNRFVEWWTFYYPYEDQYVLDDLGPALTAMGRNVLSPPAPNPKGRIYFSPEVQISPSDPEGYLDRNLFWMIGVQRGLLGSYPPVGPDTPDDFTGNAYLLGLRIRFKVQ